MDKKTSGPVFEDSHLLVILHHPQNSMKSTCELLVSAEIHSTDSSPPSSAAALTCSQLSKLLHLVNEASGTSPKCVRVVLPNLLKCRTAHLLGSYFNLCFSGKSQ